MTFHPGQKVVCVDDGPGRYGLSDRYPQIKSWWIENGKVYAVSSVSVSKQGNQSFALTGDPFGAHLSIGGETWRVWEQERFRPLAEVQRENRERSKVTAGETARVLT